ncbi:hypothetical protein [Marinimicrobium sp. C2-29]|uniref:hypothetical protein n=1 Tax=Marinimicrobium sp. C2-29 TaxID=3139825 RepID=UPI00313A4D21
MIKNMSEAENTSEPSLFTGGPLAGARAVRTRVKQDIDFLRDRIDDMEQQTRPNRHVIQTYRTMLDSRRSVLNWLDHGEEDIICAERTGTR